MKSLSDTQSKTVAVELTKLAIENGMIPKTTSAVKTAENVFDFYKTLVEKLNSDSED